MVDRRRQGCKIELSYTDDHTEAGRIVGNRYVLESELGRGSAAAVWKARDLRDDRTVAIKLLHREVRHFQKLRQRFATEAKVLLALDHPQIACAYAFDAEGSLPYVAMELVAGHSLEKELEDRANPSAPRRFSSREAIDLLQQIAGALDYAHGFGVVHRDLKPSNVLLTAGAAVKIVDFGIAKLLDRDPGEDTTQGRLLGTLMYMSPEQARALAISPRADVFSLAVIAFELLTLKRAWARHDDGRQLDACEPVSLTNYNAPARLLDRIVNEARPLVTAIFPELGAEVDQVIAKAMAKDPQDRYASAGAFVGALERALGVERTLPAAKIEPKDTLLLAPAKKRAPNARGPAAIGLIAIAFAAVAAAVTMSRSDQAAIAPVDPSPAITATTAAVQPAPRAIALDPPDPSDPPKRDPRPPMPAQSVPRKVAKTDEAAAAPRDAGERAQLGAYRAELAKLMETPSATALVALGERIAAVAAAEVEDERSRARIARLAKSSAAIGDTEGVARALEELTIALRSQSN